MLATSTLDLLKTSRKANSVWLVLNGRRANLKLLTRNFAGASIWRSQAGVCCHTAKKTALFDQFDAAKTDDKETMDKATVHEILTDTE